MPTTTHADRWRQRVWREFRAGNLTRGHRDVLLTLATFGPRPWPSHETLAERARCCTRTVQRALQAARDLGLVSWAERRIKAAWRWLRSSNQYALTVPDGDVIAVRPTTGQRVRRGEREARKMAHEWLEAATAQRALAAIAAARCKALGLG